MIPRLCSGTNRNNARKTLSLTRGLGRGTCRMASGMGGAESPLFPIYCPERWGKPWSWGYTPAVLVAQDLKLWEEILSSWRDWVKGPFSGEYGGESVNSSLSYLALPRKWTQSGEVCDNMKRLKAQVSSPRIRKSGLLGAIEGEVSHGELEKKLS